jgi:type III secretion protein N (ATPase)
MTIDLERLSQTLSSGETVRVKGRLRAVVGLALHVELPDARVGELVEITRKHRPPLLCEIVGFDDDGVTVMPLGAPDLLGRVLDGLGEPMDGGPALSGVAVPLLRPAPPALDRKRIDRPLPLGVRALDAFVTVGEGQRMGLFSAAGVGKSTLLGQIAQGSSADVVVLCLIGERGRELGDFLQDHLREDAKQRTVVVCATSDAPALLRMKCPYVATTIAEVFRDQGKRVLLLVDSVTRFARAAREVGLAAGEAPLRRGYPPSAFAALPGLLERAGNAAQGSITAFYTVLVEGDDLDEPVSDELRGLLDGHVVLSRKLAARGQHPAVDVTQSLSRLMPRLVDPQHRAAAELARAHLALYEEKRDLFLLGAYRSGSDSRLDAAIARVPEIEAFLVQREHERADFSETLATLQMLVS